MTQHSYNERLHARVLPKVRHQISDHRYQIAVLIRYLIRTLQARNRDRFAERIQSAFGDKGDAWIIRILRGLAAWLAKHPDREDGIRNVAGWTVECLKRAKGNVPEAAKLLGIGRATLYRRIEEFGIER